MSRSCLTQTVVIIVLIVIGLTPLRHGQPSLMMPARAQGAGAPAASNALIPARTADRKAAIASIQAQLRAFQKNDFQTAVHYQGGGLKRNFASTEAFRRMMVTHYPAFLHFKSVTYGAAITPDNGQTVLVAVVLTEAGGAKVKALYVMAREGGIYKVESVQAGSAVPTSAPDVFGQIT